MILLIDGDMLIYESVSSRYLDNNPTVDEETGELMTYSEEETAEFIEECWTKFKKLLDELLERFYSTEYLMAVKGQNNFRLQIYPDYKANRNRGANVNPARKYAKVLTERILEEGLGIAAHGVEADDYVRYWAEECRAYGIPYVVCTGDKDLKCIQGRYHNFQRRHMTTVEIAEEEAKRFFYEQLLKGDPTDHIPGLPRVGDVKAKEFLKDAKTEEEMQEVIVDKYMTFFGENWLDYLMSNGALLYIKKNPNDWFKPRDWGVVKEVLGD
jgi:DNA polymerase-1